MAVNKKHTMVLDVMGADGGQEQIIQGGIDAARKLGDSLHLIFVGRKEVLQRSHAGTPQLPSNISIQHAVSEVPMHISATDGVRMRDSSIAVGLRLVKNKQACAFVSPGYGNFAVHPRAYRRGGPAGHHQRLPNVNREADGSP